MFSCPRSLPPPCLILRVEYQNTNRADEDDDARKQHAERIIATYISPSASGVPGLIYTSEAQRKALAAKMKRLWRKDKPKPNRKSNRSNKEDENGSKSGPLVGRDDDGPAGSSSSPEDKQQDRGASLNNDGRAPKASRDPPPLNAGSDGGGDGESVGVGGVGGIGGGDDDDDNGGIGGNLGFSIIATGVLSPDSDSGGPQQTRSNASSSSSEESFASPTRWSTGGGGDGGGGHGGSGSGNGSRNGNGNGNGSGSDGDGEMMDGIEDKEDGGRQEVDRRALSRSLFDEILDQNAIPTIRQNSEFCLSGQFLELEFGGMEVGAVVLL